MAVLVIAGIIFLTDSFMGKIDQRVAQVEGFTRGVMAKNGPAIINDFGVQTQETLAEISNLSKNISEIFWKNIGTWISEKLSRPAPSI